MLCGHLPKVNENGFFMLGSLPFVNFTVAALFYNSLQFRIPFTILYSFILYADIANGNRCIGLGNATLPKDCCLVATMTR